MKRKGLLRRSIAILLFVLPCSEILCAQNPAAIQAAEAACGPQNARFHVEVAPHETPQNAPQGEATVYVIENAWTRTPTVRIAVDGKWVGATKGWSYLAVYVKPGQHHLCISKQTRSNKLDDNVALAPLLAKAGGEYYFLADTAGFILPGLLALEDIDADEGKLLIATRGLAKP